MTENNKPEWFEIAESDGPTQPAKVRRSLPVAAVLASALILGFGAVVAQTQEEVPAGATETTSVATNEAVAPAITTASVQNVVTTTTPRSIATASTTNGAIANPSIAKLPTGGGDDDDDDDDDDEGEHRKRGNHDEDDEDDDFEGDDD